MPKIFGAVLLGQQAGAAGVDEQRGVPGRQEARRRRGLGVRQRRAREVEQGPVEAAELEPVEHRGDLLRAGAR